MWLIRFSFRIRFIRQHSQPIITNSAKTWTSGIFLNGETTKWNTKYPSAKKNERKYIPYLSKIVQCRSNYETCTVDILSHAMASAPNVTYRQARRTTKVNYKRKYIMSTKKVHFRTNYMNHVLLIIPTHTMVSDRNATYRQERRRCRKVKVN